MEGRYKNQALGNMRTERSETQESSVARRENRA